MIRRMLRTSSSLASGRDPSALFDQSAAPVEFEAEISFREA